MVLSIVAVSLIVRREGVGEELQRAAAGAGKGVSFREAILLLKNQSTCV